MKRVVERITLVIIVLIMFTNTCFATEGYSEEVTTNLTVTSMPANTTKGLFSPRVEGVKPIYNLVDNGENYGKWVSGNEATLSNDGVTISASGYSFARVPLLKKISAGEQLTVVLNVTNNNTSNDGTVGILLETIDTTKGASSAYGINRATGIVVLTLNATNSGKTIRIYTNSAKGEITVKLYGIYEGDQTDNPNILQARGYGLIPCAQNYEFVSRGKNILDVYKIKPRDNINKVIPIKDGEFILEGSYYAVYDINGTIKAGTPIRYRATMETISGDTRNYYRLLYTDDTISISKTSGQTIIAEKDIKSVYLYNASTASAKAKYTDAILEIDKGQTLGQYIPYTQSKTEFSVPEEYPLVELPNGVKNYVNDNGLYIVNIGVHIIRDVDVIFIFSGLANVDIAFIQVPLIAVDGDTYIMQNNTFLEGAIETVAQEADNTSQIGNCYYGDAHRMRYVIPKGQSLEDTRAELKDKIIYYQLAQPITLKDGENGYHAPSSLQAFQNGDLVISPVNSESGPYNDKINIQRKSMPIKSMKKVIKLKAGTQTIIDLSKVQVASDGLSFAIDGANKGDIYVYTYEYPTNKFINPTIKFSTPINKQGQVNSTIDAIDKQNKQIEYILEQLKMIQQDLDEIKGAIN